MKIKKSVLKELAGVIETLANLVPNRTVVKRRSITEINVECSLCGDWALAVPNTYILTHKPDCLELQRLTLPDRIQALKASLGLVESDKGIEYGQGIEWDLKQPLSEHEKIIADYQETAKQIDASVAKLEQDSLERIRNNQ